MNDKMTTIWNELLGSCQPKTPQATRLVACDVTSKYWRSVQFLNVKQHGFFFARQLLKSTTCSRVEDSRAISPGVPYGESPQITAKPLLSRGAVAFTMDV
jgi:hypothetical protein